LSKGKQSKNISLLKNTLFAALRKVLMPTRPQLATIFRQHNSALMQISPPLTRALPIAMATSNQQIFLMPNNILLLLLAQQE
jgi:hypothetical protein